MSKHLTIIPTVAILLAASCSNDDMDGTLANGPVTAQVTADISNGQTVTRISSNGTTESFEADDVINVVASAEKSYEYTKQSDGTWASDNPYYFQDREDVTFQGWYAAPEVTVADNTISINTAEQETNDDGWNLWDILVTPEVTTNISTPTVNFTGDNAFGHIMSQATFTFTAGEGVSDLTALTGYALKSITTDATFNTLSCALEAGSTIGDISQEVSATSGVACDPIILVPQAVTDNLLLEVTYNDQTYYAELALPSESAGTLQAGINYAFSVIIDNSGLVVNSAEIKNWDTPTTDDADASLIAYTYDEDNNTYTVYNEAGLLAWSEYTRSGHWDTNCTLANDITLTSNWTVVGYSSSRYIGTFDGNGKTIKGLTVYGGSYQGLIGCLGSEGVVKNLMLTDASISTGDDYYYIGAVVGYNLGTVTACYSATGTVTGTNCVGGVVGFNNKLGTVTDCYSSGIVSGSSYIGGVVGENNGTVTACYSTSTVSGSYEAGGVVGDNYGSGTVTACYSTGTVSVNEYHTGGVVGSDYGGTITACYWNNSTTNYGIGYDYNSESDSGSGSNDNATKVDGEEVTWKTAAETMNDYLTDWQYVVNAAYDGNDTTIAPLLLEEVTE